MSNQMATVSLSGTLPDKLEAAAAAGFDGVEIFENDLAACDLAPRDVRKLLDHLGLTADMYQPFRDLEGWKGVDRDRAFERGRRKFDLMGELGCNLMLLCSNAMPHSDPDEQRIVDDLSDFAALADSRESASLMKRWLGRPMSTTIATAGGSSTGWRIPPLAWRSTASIRGREKFR